MVSLPPCKRTASPSGFGPRCELGQPASERARIERLALQARSLGHPARVSIVAELATHRSLAAGDIAVESGLARSTISEHLRLLREAALICACQDGPNVRYRLQPTALLELAHGIAELGVAELGLERPAEDSPCFGTKVPVANRRLAK